MKTYTPLNLTSDPKTLSYVTLIILLIGIFGGQIFYASSHASTKGRATVKASTQSSVKVLSAGSAGESLRVATSSGTYLTYSGHYFILTAAHALIGGCEYTIVTFDRVSTECMKIVAMDLKKDYVLFESGEMPNRIPYKIRPKEIQKRQPMLLDKTLYTGYPNGIGSSTWGGSVAAIRKDRLFIQTFAWPGSSGAGVFSQKAELIGVVTAVDVGTSTYGEQVLENVVIATPVGAVDWKSLLYGYNK
jgi:hypothetical protein